MKKSTCWLPGHGKYATPAEKAASKIVTEGCVTEGKATFCVGDRVERAVPKSKTQPAQVFRGVVLGLVKGANNAGKAKMAANVCMDSSEPAMAYPYLFGELRKARGLTGRRRR